LLNCCADCGFAECYNAGCRYAECRYADCCGAVANDLKMTKHVRVPPPHPPILK
jgi:hypothetical protein